MDEILITGDRAILRSVQEVKAVSIDDFYEELAKSAGIRTPVLPERVIFYASKNERKIYLTHQHPGVKKINVRIDSGSVREYSLSLPHVYFMHAYFNSAMESLYAYCSAEPVNDTADMLYKLPLKNIHADGLVCIGDDLKFNLDGRLADKIARTEDFFWESKFNSDLDTNFQRSLPEVFKQGMSPAESKDPLLVWERMSFDQSFDPSRLSWKPLAKLTEIATDLLEG